MPTTDPRGESFQTTRWSLIAAANGPSSEKNDALAELCAAYWFPLYAFVRRRGHSADDSADLTQGFFTQLLEKENLAAADPSRGRFRSFLLSSLTNFICNESDRAHAMKRGGNQKTVSFDVGDAEARYLNEPATNLTPEKLFDRQWAVLLLDRALGEVRAEYNRMGNERLFEGLKTMLTFAPDAKSYSAIATELGMTEGAVKVAVHRLRQRYRQQLRMIIADSVASEEDVEEEIRHLFSAFSTVAGE